MGKKDKDNLSSLTTKVAPRVYLAVEKLAKHRNLTESALLREILTGYKPIADTYVSDEEIEQYRFAVSKRKPKAKKRPWYVRWFCE